MDKRITIVCGHYGSGKTEFSVNYAIKLAREGKRTALADLDIANPYFRSRERQQFLEENGVALYSNVYHADISADMPAITAEIRGPLEDDSCHVVVDSGGDDTGARVLNQFRKYFLGPEAGLYCVVNANRPETADFEGALAHIRSICGETGIPLAGLISNTHMLRETRAEDVIKGYGLCRELSSFLEIPVEYCCASREICDKISTLKNIKEDKEFRLFPMELYMRPAWLDR